MVPERSKGGQHAGATAVLFSAGLDSAVLAAWAAREAPVVPIHVRAGLAWEDDERRAAERLFATGRMPAAVRAPVELQVDMRDVYTGAHWAVRGVAPADDTPDEDVYLEGRNVVLLSKAAVFCARGGIQRIQLGPLAGNPFPDATPEFFRAMEAALRLGLNAPLSIEAPFSRMSKADVIRLGLQLGVPLGETLSCMQPRDGRHCGRCSKCRERRDAFREAGVEDPAGG